MREIAIVVYDPSWPATYNAEKRRILGAIGPHLVAIEHVGSTAVPGLGAKPIIDIMAAIRSLGEAPAIVEPLAALGYRYMPELEGDMPYRRYFRRGTDEHHTHHLHFVEPGTSFWERHLLFRDYLRAHPDVALEYDTLKRSLAALHRTDVAEYTTDKTEFVRSVEARARVDRAAGRLDAKG